MQEQIQECSKNYLRDPGKQVEEAELTNKLNGYIHVFTFGKCALPCT